MIVNAKVRIDEIKVKDFNKSDGSVGKVYSYKITGLADNRSLFCSSFSEIPVRQSDVIYAHIDVSWSSNRNSYNLILVDFD